MGKKTDLWMPWYLGDYLRDTTHLSRAEHGSYLLMLAHAWMHNGLLPLQDERLARIAHATAEQWSECRAVLLEFFTKTDDGYAQKRLSEELLKARHNLDQRTQAGRLSAAKRWGNARYNAPITDVVTATVTKPQRRNTPSPSPVNKNINPMVADATGAQFEDAWGRYPKRSGNNPKRDAFDKWRARVLEGVKPEDMLAGVERYRAWCEHEGKVGTELVMQAVRFFGRSRPFEQSFELPKANAGNGSAARLWWSSEAMTIAKGKELGIEPRPGESAADFKGRINAILAG